MKNRVLNSESPYTNLTLYYFSGTGNARAVSGWIAEQAVVSGLEVETVYIPDVVRQRIVLPDGALLGVCFPTHGFNAPPLIYRFLRSLPRGRNDFFLVNTRGGTKLGPLFLPGVSGLALLLPMVLLMLKGYRCSGMRPVDLPSNWLSLHPAIRGTAVVKMVDRCRRITRRFADKILSGGQVRRWAADLPIDLLVSPLSLLYYALGRFWLARTLVAVDGCTGCGLCLKDCPVGAIVKVNGRPFWTFRCESCMKCISSCPEHSIEVMHGVSAVLWTGLFFIVPAAVLSFVSICFCSGCNDGWIASLIKFLLCIFPGMLLLALGYRGIHRLMAFRSISKLVALTSLTYYRWWGRYRFPEDKKDSDWD